MIAPRLVPPERDRQPQDCEHKLAALRALLRHDAQALRTPRAWAGRLRLTVRHPRP